MERNFTDERKSEIRDVIEASLLRWIQLDLQIESTSELGAELGLNVAKSSAEVYQERVVKKLKRTFDVLEEKYEDAKQIDTVYATNHIADAMQSIQDLNTYILCLAETILPGNGVIDEGKRDSLNATWNNYNSMFEKMQQKREFAYDVENLVYGLNGTRRNVEWVAIKQQEYVVEAYELIHPEMKEKMNKFLSTGEPNVLTANDITSIKYIAYTAPEPYRTVYLECIDKYEFACIYDDPMDRTSNYKYNDKKIYIYDSGNALKNCSRGAYMTIFHESGHAIDYTVDDIPKTFYCAEFTTYSEKIGKEVTLQEAIYYDVYTRIEEQICLRGITDETAKQKILDTFKYGQGSIEGLDDTELGIRNEVLNYFCTNLKGEEHAAAGDVYGGVTNLIISGKDIFGHKPDENEDISDYQYWYNSDGTATYRQSKEMWAEYFASCMTGDRRALSSIQTYFPEASKVLEAIGEQMEREIHERE